MNFKKQIYMVDKEILNLKYCIVTGPWQQEPLYRTGYRPFQFYLWGLGGRVRLHRLLVSTSSWWHCETHECRVWTHRYKGFIPMYLTREMLFLLYLLTFIPWGVGAKEDLTLGKYNNKFNKKSPKLAYDKTETQ